jgi:hypothetical protein
MLFSEKFGAIFYSSDLVIAKFF